MAQAPQGVSVDIRLLTPVSSRFSKRGTPVQAVVVTPGRSADGLVVAPGAVVSGTVRQVHRVGLGFVRERAKLVLDFDEVQSPGGQALAITSRLLNVDNARESVDSSGAIRGIRATASISHRMNFRVARYALNHPAGLLPLAIMETCLFRFPEPEIEYHPGVDMRLYIETAGGALPLEPEKHGTASGRLPSDQIAELETLLLGAPLHSHTVRQGERMDLINLAYVGTRQAIENAFTAAGWTDSTPVSAFAGLQAVRSIAAQSSFPRAPMRPLLVEGGQPDMTWQKTLNTFAKRHHLRVWERSEQWRGQAVWLSAATHDVAVGFSPRYGFTHRIDTDIDREREKVVNDLRFTGCVDAVARVERPGVLADDLHGGANKVTTDGVVTALVLNDCESPRHVAAAAQPERRPSFAVLAIRRATLTARNHILRNNLPWQISEAGVMAFRTVRKWRLDRIRHRALLGAAQQRRNAALAHAQGGQPGN